MLWVGAFVAALSLPWLAEGEYCSANSQTCYPGTASARNAVVRERAKALSSSVVDAEVESFVESNLGLSLTL